MRPHKPREPAPRFLAHPQPTLVDGRRLFPASANVKSQNDTMPGRVGLRLLAAAVFCLLQLLSSFSYADEAIMVRVAWGGGSEKLWEGSIAVSRGTISQPRPLGIEADEPGSMWLEDGRLLIRQRSPRSYDGVDIIVTAPADARLIVQLTGPTVVPSRRFAAGTADRSSPGRHLQRVPQLATR